MKSPGLLRARNIIVFAVGIAAGVVLCAKFPEIPKKVASVLFPVIIKDPPPTPEQINRVLSGSLALVESQFTYYVHVTRNTKFAPDIRELGLGFGVENRGGVVMVLEVWNASDAVTQPSPLHGYLFKSLPVAMGPDKKDGFVVAAYPADERNDEHKWPLYLSIVPDAKGGLIGMSSRDTWEIEDPAAAAEIRALLQRSELKLGDLEKFSPENFPRSFLIENFKKEIE